MVKPPETHRNNEVDIIELLLKAVIIVRANFWLIVLFFILGSGLGATYFMTSKKQYESKMVISSNILTTTYAKFLLDNINEYLSEKGNKIVAEDLNITEDMTREIARLEIENLSKSEGSAIAESDRYLITVRIYDNKILPDLQKGVVAYLENHEFVKVRVNQRRAFLKEMITNIDQELKELKQFKSDIYDGKFFNIAKGNVMFDPTTVNSKVLELSQRKVEYEQSLELSSSVQVIEGFTAFNRVVKPKLFASLAGGTSLGLFFVGAFLAIKSVRRLLRLAEANDAKNAS